MNIFGVIWKLHIPIVAFLVLLFLIIKSRPSKGSTKFTLSFWGLLNAELSIKQMVLIKTILIVFSIIFLAIYYLTIDFTQFYPQKLRMTVHFDKNGLQNLYKEIGIDEIDGIPIILNDDSIRENYFKTSDKTLNEKFKLKDFFSKALLDSTATMVTEGSTTFIVKKGEGVQNYYIEEASGELTHSLYEPKNDTKVIKTSFTKTTSPNDRIHFNYLKTFFGKNIIISPLFTENLVINSKEGSKENIQLDHFMYGVTSLQVSPIPEFSNTLYLYRAKGKLVPICYAIYIDE